MSSDTEAEGRVVPFPACACGHRYDHHRGHGVRRCYRCDDCAGYEPATLSPPNPSSEGDDAVQRESDENYAALEAVAEVLRRHGVIPPATDEPFTVAPSGEIQASPNPSKDLDDGVGPSSEGTEVMRPPAETINPAGSPGLDSAGRARVNLPSEGTEELAARLESPLIDWHESQAIFQDSTGLCDAIDAQIRQGDGGWPTMVEVDPLGSFIPDDLHELGQMLCRIAAEAGLTRASLRTSTEGLSETGQRAYTEGES